MNLQRLHPVSLGLLPLLMALALQAGEPGPMGGLEVMPAQAGAMFSHAARMQDQGPEGVFVDMQGHDKNDDVVGTVYYNNQSKITVRIESIYVHGKNISTQGRIPIGMDVHAGSKVQLVVIKRDKLGEPATGSVDVHFQ
jgi:hypothetical protein